MEDEAHFNKKEIEAKFNSFSDEFSNIILPVKKLVFHSENGDERFDLETSNDINSQPVHQYVHNESEFHILCFCKHCLDYRNDILQMFNDHVKTEKIWKIFEKAISKLYLPLVVDSSPEILQMYDYLLTKCSNWLVNGIINKVKQEHIDFLLEFPWSDKMVVVIFSTILIEDDPHQLFELMSFLVECFVKVYASALTTNYQIARDSMSSAKFLLTYILNGYEKLCAIAEVMSELLFDFERNYLANFKCSWILLNKKMYQKYFYTILTTVIPEFVIKLKAEVSKSEYRTIMTKFKEFEVDMTSTEKEWQVFNALLQDYQISEENQNRKTRIEYVNSTFNAICTNNELNTNLSCSEWKSNEVGWEEMVAYIKKNWNCVVKDETFKIEGNDCKHCQYLLTHKKTLCTCIQCLRYNDMSSSLMDKVPENVLCIKCGFMEALTKEDYDIVIKLAHMSIDDQLHDIKYFDEEEIVIAQEEITTNLTKTDVYHYCWTVFKHLKDRKPYQNTVIKSNLFCENCQKTSCLLATKILNNEISDEIARYLINHYQPFGITNEEIMQMLPKIWLCFRKGHFPHDHYDNDFIIKTFWIFVISAYATCFARLNIIKSIPTIDRLILTNNDIKLSSTSKETSLQSTTLLEFIEKVINLLQANGKGINSNPTMLNDVNKDIKINSTMVRANANANVVDDTILLSKEIPVRNDDTENLKNNINNCGKLELKNCEDSGECKKPVKEENSSKSGCSHEKEYHCNRKNETRDRLRKKLKKLVTIAKKPYPLAEKSEDTVLPSKETNSQSLCNNANLIVKDKKNVYNIDKSSNSESSILTIPDVKKNICEDRGTFKPNCDEKWVKDALSYIEGSKNGNGIVNNKKAAKRQKQKMKKEECKRLEELKDLRIQFHEVYFKEFMAKKERKTEQLSKKKDKKRVLDLENSVKKLSKIKLRIEKDILELISTLKSINSEFKFTYLPTKEQQQDFLKNNSQVKDAISNCCHSVDIIKVEKEKIVPCKTNTVVPQCEQTEFIKLAKNERETDMTDVSKRIVTIRRVNMPNNNEPQVTVTAKGSSPDEDKVLYTFINGRLVQRDSGNGSELEKSPRINFTQLSEIKNALLQSNNIMSYIGNNPNSERNRSITKTKTQLKKERKLAKKLAENLCEENKMDQQLNMKINEINLKNLNLSECEIIPKKQVNSSVTKSKHKKENNSNQNIPKSSKHDPKNNEIKNKLNENCNQKKNHCSIQHSAPKISDQIKINENNDSERKSIELEKKQVKEEKKRIRKVYNKNILENNQFNLLNLEDSESFTEESESDTDKTKCIKEVIKNKPPMSIVKKKNKNSVMPSKLLESIICPSSNKKKAKCKNQPVSTKKNCHIDVKTNFQQSSNSLNLAKPPEKKIITLEESMDNLNINSNTERLNKNSNVTITNISIMEQLKRGIQVENLTLPPGITLTKVNPAKAEELKAKTGSIHNLSQKLVPPQSSVHSLFSPENILNTEFMPPTVNQFLTDNRGVIMVDNITSKTAPQKNVPQCHNDCKNKAKIKKRKNRNKTNISSESKRLPESKNVASNIITLRNPMFYLSNSESIPYCNLADRVPQTTDPQVDQPATIIRNKNGMFTIRNPILYQNTSGSNANNNYGAFSPNYYTSMRSFGQDGTNNSYLPDNAANNLGKCMSPIGSEMKSAQQKQCTMFQNQTFKNSNHTTDSCDYVNNMKSFQHDSFFYNSYGNNYCGPPPTPIAKNNMFRSSENLPHHSINQNGSNIHRNNVQTNYNKLTSLLDLKRLSNEVTIHNMNDMELPPERIAQVLNQRDNIEDCNSHNYDLDNQNIHFEMFNNMQEHSTDYLKANGRPEISMRKVKAKNQGSDPIDLPLLQTIENNTFCSINSCN